MARVFLSLLEEYTALYTLTTDVKQSITLNYEFLMQYNLKSSLKALSSREQSRRKKRLVNLQESLIALMEYLLSSSPSLHISTSQDSSDNLNKVNAAPYLFTNDAPENKEADCEGSESRLAECVIRLLTLTPSLLQVTRSLFALLLL